MTRKEFYDKLALIEDDWYMQYGKIRNFSKNGTVELCVIGKVAESMNKGLYLSHDYLKAAKAIGLRKRDAKLIAYTADSLLYSDKVRAKLVKLTKLEYLEKHAVKCLSEMLAGVQKFEFVKNGCVVDFIEEEEILDK